MAAFLYEFDWDPVKAQANFSKHGVDFERAATVFLGPLADGLRLEKMQSVMMYSWFILLNGWRMTVAEFA